MESILSSVLAFHGNCFERIVTMFQCLVALFLEHLLTRSGDIEENPGPSRYRGIGDSVLKIIAEIITEREKIQSVGTGLSISEVDIDMHRETSHNAYRMLLNWKNKTSQEMQCEKLVAALNDAECRDIAGIIMLHQPGASAATRVGYSVHGITVGIQAMTVPTVDPKQLLTDEMINILLETPMSSAELFALREAMGIQPSPDGVCRKKRKLDNTHDTCVEMIKEWRQRVRDQDQVAALCELLVAADMKSRADGFYERCDIVINENLLEELKKNTGHEKTSLNINENGGQLHVEKYGVILRIPRGALEHGTQITMKVLTKLPFKPYPVETEIPVSYGFQFSPSGLTFRKPVTLTTPHCADLTDPKRVKYFLYLGQSASVTRIELSTKTCNVRQFDFDLLLEHFCWCCITCRWDSRWVRGINMLCMPFLPTMIPDDKKVVMDVWLYRNIKGYDEPTENKQSTIRACLPRPVEFTMQYRRKMPLTISYDIGDDQDEQRVELDFTDVVQIVKAKPIYFDLDLTRRTHLNRINLWLKPHRTQPIKFKTAFESSASSSSPRTPRRSSTRSITDERQLMKLAQLLRSDHYYILCYSLGIKYNSANNILQSVLNDYQRAYEKILMNWKDRTGGAKEELMEALTDTGLGGLCSEFFK